VPITIINVDESHPEWPVVTLSSVPVPAWADAFNAYCDWAKGSPAPDGVPPEVTFPTVAKETEIKLTRDQIHLHMRPPGTSYVHISAFIDEAIAYANSRI